MFKKLGKFCILFIFGHICFISAAKMPSESVVVPECLEKYGVSDTSSSNNSNRIEKIKIECANLCSFSSKKSSLLGYSWDEFAKICLLVENTPINDERQKNCSNKFSTTLGNSIKSRTQYYRTISVKRMQFYCAIICRFPSVEIYWSHLYHQATIQRFCPALENLQEKSEEMEMCFARFNASTEFMMERHNNLEMAKFICAISCISPNLLQSKEPIMKLITPTETKIVTIENMCSSLEMFLENPAENSSLLQFPSMEDIFVRSFSLFFKMNKD